MGRRIGSPKPALLLFVVGFWPILTGLSLDLIDLAIGDIAQGPEWSIAGAIGAATASLPTTLACLIVRTRRTHFYLLSGGLVGAISGGAIFAWPFLTHVDPLATGYYGIASILTVIGALFTGLLFSTIRRPDRDAPS